MHKNEFERNWHQIKEKIPKKWERFTPEEVERMNGTYDQFVSHLQTKYKLTKDGAEREMGNWQESHLKKKAVKGRLPVGGEETLSQIEIHAELAHEDKDPIYPFQPIERKNSPEDKNKSQKKRKAG